MVQLLKIREQIYRFVGRFEIYVLAAVRFMVAYAAFYLINSSTGYMKALSDYPIALILALLCSFSPAGLMMFFAVVLILLQFYALSNVLCLVTAMIFVILFCVYFRFSTRKGLYAILTPLLSVMGIPYVMPVSCGLLDQPYTVISVVCGEVTYFLMKHVTESSALFSSANEISTSSIITLAVTEILLDREMYLYLAAFAAGAIVVYCVRKLPVDQSYLASVVVGIVVQLVVIGAGEVYLGNTQAVTGVVVGCVVSLLIALVLAFMTRSLDYSRVEHLQFEDDEYFYYVKAVPKAFVIPEDKQVKHIHKKKSRSRKGQKSRSLEVENGDTLEEQVLRELNE